MNSHAMPWCPDCLLEDCVCNGSSRTTHQEVVLQCLAALHNHRVEQSQLKEHICDHERRMTNLQRELDAYRARFDDALRELYNSQSLVQTDDQRVATIFVELTYLANLSKHLLRDATNSLRGLLGVSRVLAKRVRNPA